VKKGMTTLRQDGADKVLKGITSVDEVVRVTQKETQ
jgi:type II secretory ATPase GspE/PulE/Tfp pilus assembly ATPase PilB-like protein